MADPVLAHYSLGATDAEHHRLIALASHEEEQVVDACSRAGIGEGATVLDCGCGPLGALAALARVVGPGGNVIGIDGSASALAKARELLRNYPFHKPTRIANDRQSKREPGRVGLCWYRKQGATLDRTMTHGKATVIITSGEVGQRHDGERAEGIPRCARDDTLTRLVSRCASSKGDDRYGPRRSRVA